jgi:two-component system sensor histidine kinase TctE
MAGHREQLSLFGEILDWMLAPLLLLWPMSVALTWLVAQNIANRPYDRELGELTREVAGQVAALNSSEAPIRNRARMEMDLAVARLLKSDDEDRVFFQVLGTRGEFVAGDADLPVPLDPPGPGNGVRFRDDELRDEAVRVAYLWLPALAVDGGSGPLVQIAETLDKRSRLATEIIKGVILPQFVILPLAVLLVWLALARGIRPLAELQQRIRRRESSTSAPSPSATCPKRWRRWSAPSTTCCSGWTSPSARSATSWPTPRTS